MENHVRQCHRSLAILILAAGIIASSPGRAQSVSRSTEASAAPSQSPAFTYQLGETTLDAARVYWSQNGMKILRAGHMALGTGSGVEGQGKVAAEKVLLVDVAGVDFEGLTMARFGFFDNKLYRIQASLASALNSANSANLSEVQLKALAVTLRTKYGKPSQELRSLLADKASGPDLLVWKLPEGKLTLNANAINGSLILSNEKMETDIKTYIKAYCETVNTPGHITCW
jgi:hypothetical protein